MSNALLFVVATAVMFLGMGWLALSLPSHWRQVHKGQPASGKLRITGYLAVFVSGGICLVADNPSMAVLEWFILIALCAFLTAMTLSYRPALLRFIPVFTAA